MVIRRLGGLLAASALVFAACSGSTSTQSAPASAGGNASAPAASPSSAVKAGGTLVVGLDGDMVYADPALESDSNSSYVNAQTVENLFGLKYGTVGEVIPVLAAELPTPADGGKTYTVKLRTGIKFHDGTDFNAAAVKYNYDRWKKFPKGPLQDNAYYYGAVFGGFGADSNIVSVDALDDSTVVFHLKGPQSNFLIAQTIQPFGISSPTALKANNADNPALDKNGYAQGTGGQGHSMVGTGPFIFKEWVPNDHITVIKNPSYWDAPNAAKVDQIVFKPMKDETAKLQALQSGDIDLAQTVAPADVQTIKGNSKLQVIDRGQSCNLGHLAFNQDPAGKGAVDTAAHTLLQNKNIRFAIASALNKKAYIDAFYAGLAKPADNWMPPATEYYKPENLPTYDVNKAKSLVQASGVPADQLKIDFYYPSDVVRPYMPDPKGLAQAIAQDLQAVGFTVNLKSEGWRTGYISHEEVGVFPMWLIGWTCDWAGPDNFLQTAEFHYNGNTPSPEFAYRNDELNKTMNDALAATDTNTAQTLWQKAQDLIAADMPSVPLVNSAPPAGAAAYVMGFQGAGNFTEHFNTVWLNK
ncbi:MAG: ABC transporter substrate-binding protein [Candidatus Limnocylindrales bacterium]